MSIVDRLLVEVVETRTFHSGGDYLALLPEDLPTQFTNKDLAGSLGIAVPKARMVTYTLKHAGLIREVGKRGRKYCTKSVSFPQYTQVTHNKVPKTDVSALYVVVWAVTNV